MKVRFLKIWLAVRSSLWFIPSIMALSTVIFALAIIALDRRVDVYYKEVDWLIYGGSSDGARALLSTIGASMVSITGVTFSVTLVALALASSQFGPRLLRNFIKDKGNQFVLGTFISTFIYSLIVLLAVRSNEGDYFVPRIAVGFSFIFSICSLGVLIYFIHHVSSSIQADNVVKKAYDELIDDIDDFMFHGKELKADDRISEEEAFEAIKGRPFYEFYLIGSSKAGFLQVVDYSGLFHWAESNDCIIHVMVRAGEYVARSETIARLFLNRDLTRENVDEINNLFILGYQRTPDQDIEFSIRQIVEIAIRALSPGINDPHTAMACIQWLGSAITKMSYYNFPFVVRVNKNDAIRLILKRHTYAGVVECCYGHIRQYAQANAEVSLSMLTALRKAMMHALQAELRDALKNMADIIVEGNRTQIVIEYDLKRIENAYKDLIKVYAL